MRQMMQTTGDTDACINEVQALIRLRDVCDRMTVTLRDEPVDRVTELQAETKLRLLARGLEDKIRRYRATHGGRTGESQIVSAGLEALQQDLEWLRREHDTASRKVIGARLRHAVRSAVNALTLLRWAWI